MIEQGRKITVTDDKGKEIEMEIILTFDNNDKKYVVYYNPNSDDDNIYASIYDDEGHLLPIESDEEWDMVDEVVNCYFDDLEGKEEK